MIICTADGKGRIHDFNLWVHYPSKGKDCKLLRLGDKDWRTGKVKTYGECTFSSVLEKLPKKASEFSDYDDEFLRELKNIDLSI